MKTAFHLMATPNGARLTRADRPGLPIPADEVAATAVACAQVAASAIHVHGRDAIAAHSVDPARHDAAVGKIRARTDIAIQISTETAGIFDISAQRRRLKQLPANDASVALREISRSPDQRTRTYQAAAGRGIDPQHISYTPDKAGQLQRHFDRRDILPQSRRVIFVLGRYDLQRLASPDKLDPYLTAMGAEDLNLAACAFGFQEQDCLRAAPNRGGNVRIELENNHITPSDTPYQNNETAVADLVQVANDAGFQTKQVPA